MNNRNRWILIFLMSFFCLQGLKVDVYAVEKESTKILEGVFIDGVNVSGMNREEAVKAVSGRVDEVKGYNIQLNVADKTVSVTADELGLCWGNEEVVDKALSFGQNGNVIKRYKAQKDLEQEPVRLTLDYDVIRSKAKAAIEEKCLPFNSEPVNATMQRGEDGFEIEKDHPGITLDVDKSVDIVADYLSHLWIAGVGSVELEAKVEEAKHTAGALYAIQDRLGSANTDYSSSSEHRAKNIKNGTTMLNATILFPGESFSVCDAMLPFTEENGYAMAGSYASGAVVESFGGGICQVSTTLYLALLRAEIEVKERHNHSMTVKYVKLSMDAAISEGSKDLCFVNNLDTPIYIEGYTNGGDVGFVIYGKEYRPEERSVEYESETIETLEPDVKLTAVNEPIGKIEQSQAAYTGYKACLWKVVTENGEETRTKVNDSTYAMGPTMYNVGTVTDDSAAAEKIRAAIDKNDLDAVYNVINNM